MLGGGGGRDGCFAYVARQHHQKKIKLPVLSCFGIAFTLL